MINKADLLNTIIWRKIGFLTSRLQRIVYSVPIQPGACIVEHLGAVKPRHDGRWNWWRWESRYHKWNGTGQGVEPDEESAKTQVLEGWL